MDRTHNLNGEIIEIIEYIKVCVKSLETSLVFYVTLRVLVQFCCGFRQSLVKEKEIINLESFFRKNENEEEENEDEHFLLFF